MPYVKDDSAYTRGIGAIDAVDRASPRLKRIERGKALRMVIRDRHLARFAIDGFNAMGRDNISDPPPSLPPTRPPTPPGGGGGRPLPPRVNDPSTWGNPIPPRGATPFRPVIPGRPLPVRPLPPAPPAPAPPVILIEPRANPYNPGAVSSGGGGNTGGGKGPSGGGGGGGGIYVDPDLYADQDEASADPVPAPAAAKANNNRILLFAGLAIGGYLLYKHRGT